MGYRDHCDDAGKRLLRLDLTEDVEEFLAFVGRVVAIGGGDDCEDVLGGMAEAAGALQWDRDRANKCLVHVCDMPAHGIR